MATCAQQSPTKTKLTVQTGKTTGLAQKTSCAIAMDILIRLSDKAGINSELPKWSCGKGSQFEYEETRT